MAAGKPGTPLWRRLLWLFGLWGASVLALGLLAWLMRLFMGAAGLSGG